MNVLVLIADSQLATEYLAVLPPPTPSKLFIHRMFIGVVTGLCEKVSICRLSIIGFTISYLNGILKRTHVIITVSIWRQELIKMNNVISKLLLFIGLTFFSFPVFASSYDLGSILWMLVWIVMNNIIPICLALIVVYIIVAIYRKSSKQGYYIDNGEIEVWQVGEYLDVNLFNKTAEKLKLTDYRVIMNGEIIELNEQQKARHGETYQIKPIAK